MTCTATHDTVTVSRGERIDWIWQYLDADGRPVELLDVTVSVIAASPPVLMSATVSIEDATHGLISVVLPKADAALLHAGRSNWLRIELAWTLFPGPPNRVTPKIWIEVL